MVQSHFLWASQIVGKSISVGRRIFSIVGGLGFEGGLCYGFVQLQLVGQGRHLLHRLRKRGEALVLRSSRLLQVEGFTGRVQ